MENGFNIEFIGRNGIAREDRETIISWGALEERAEVYTTDPATIRRMEKLLENNPQEYRRAGVTWAEGRIIAVSYTMPVALVNMRAKTRQAAPEAGTDAARG